jgi:hypothetical protein
MSSINAIEHGGRALGEGTLGALRVTLAARLKAHVSAAKATEEAKALIQGLVMGLGGPASELPQEGSG